MTANKQSGGAGGGGENGTFLDFCHDRMTQMAFGENEYFSNE